VDFRVGVESVGLKPETITIDSRTIEVMPKLLPFVRWYVYRVTDRIITANPAGVFLQPWRSAFKTAISPETITIDSHRIEFDGEGRLDELGDGHKEAQRPDRWIRLRRKERQHSL